jgi:hypothetical protein
MIEYFLSTPTDFLLFVNFFFRSIF